jgi:hypothetical protein
MLATCCAVCGRELLDPVSVETGIGPTCRESTGYLVDVEPDKRARANAIVHEIACRQKGLEVGKLCEELRALGFEVLAARILDRVARIKVSIAGNLFAVKAPYSEEAVAILRRVPGRWWDGENKVNTFPLSAREALWRALHEAYAGEVAVGPKGVFLV